MSQRQKRHLESQQSRSRIDIVTCDSKVSPMFLFEEYCFLDEQLKSDVKRHCIERGYIPLIDYDADLQSWIFHSISHGNLIWKKPIASKYEQLTESIIWCEKRLEKAFAAHLTSLGIVVHTQVPCSAGVADIVTKDTIYELKHLLDRSALFSAIGQVLLYRQCLNSESGVAIVCGRSLVPHLHNVSKAFGIEIIVWHDQ